MYFPRPLLLLLSLLAPLAFSISHEEITAGFQEWRGEADAIINGMGLLSFSSNLLGCLDSVEDAALDVLTLADHLEVSSDFEDTFFQVTLTVANEASHLQSCYESVNTLVLEMMDHHYRFPTFKDYGEAFL